MNNTQISLKVINTTIINPVFLKVVLSVNFLFLTEAIGICGIVANVVNIVNFNRQGYKEGVNITLTALAISDLGVLVTQQVYVHIYNPWTDESSFVMLKYHLLLFVVYANEFFNRVSGLVTSFAAFERCLCVALPMKVKMVVTQKVAIAVNISIFVSLIGYIVVPYCFLYVDSKYLPSYNRTFAYVYFSEDKDVVLNLFYLVAACFIPNLTFLMLVLFTVVLITKLKSKSAWRNRVLKTSLCARDIARHKERKTIAMLSIVSAMYVVCFIPHSALNLALGLVDGMEIYGVYFDITTLTYTFTTLLETINCSMTTIIYLKMSSKYRKEFFGMFICTKKKYDNKDL